MSLTTTLQTGTVFAADYKILRLLSRGGMGEVYVAEQLSTGRERALKIMLPSLVTNEDLRRRFSQEAKIGASIDSEHIVEVVGAGIDAATGSPWLAMELLQGEDFGQRLARVKRLPVPELVAVFEQLSHAIGEAHRKGIVHRDLKPENFFLASSRRSAGTEVVKVLDFGIAKLLEQGRTSATGAMGTPLWMSPEQTQSGVGIGPSADVWALGLIAFRALTGELFWSSARDSNTSPMMLLREVLFEPIPPARSRAAELGYAALPEAFDGWFARCVTRDPKDRFPSATEMQDALRRIAAAPTSRRTPPPVPVREGQGAARTSLPPPSAPPLALSPPAPTALAPALATEHAVARTEIVQTSNPVLVASPHRAPLRPTPGRTSPWVVVGVGAVALGAAGTGLGFALRPSAPPSLAAQDTYSPTPSEDTHEPPATPSDLVLVASHSPSPSTLASATAPPPSAAPSGSSTARANAGAVAVNGRLPAEVIQRVVRTRFATMRRCYETGLAADPTIEGTVTVNFTIDPSGNVASASPSGNLPASVQSCIASAFSGLSFPAPEGGSARVSYPISFAPG